MLLCIDIGNTHTHLGLVAPDHTVSARADFPTPSLDDPAAGLPAILRALPSPPRALAFCSVVPAASPRLRAVAAAALLPCWQLTHEVRLGLPLSYPRPAEIGQDRLANAAAARALTPGPAVVIDLGTAVTFDIITTHGGYEGGIIAPGPALVTRYLHEKTAQLPLVEDLDTPLTSPIGKSTAEAIRIGAVLGFAGLIQALLDAVLADLAHRGEPPPLLLASGGAATLVKNRLHPPALNAPDLTLQGLAAAWSLNHPPA